MDDAQAVAEVCALGSRIEKGLMEAEKTTPAETPEEAEMALRQWKPGSNGGHDPIFVSHLSPVGDTENPVHPRGVLSDD